VVGEEAETAWHARVRGSNPLSSTPAPSLVRASREIDARADRRPAPGSSADKELQSQTALVDDWSATPVEAVYSIARLIRHGAEDHQLAVEQPPAAPNLLRTPVETLVRTAVDASAGAWWLLDPDIDMRTRVARGMTERLFALHQDRKVQAKAGHSTLDLDQAVGRIMRSPPRHHLQVLGKAPPKAISERRPDCTAGGFGPLEAKSGVLVLRVERRHVCPCSAVGEYRTCSSPSTRTSRPAVNRSSRLSIQTCSPRATRAGKAGRRVASGRTGAAETWWLGRGRAAR
jgi:hypothetical protein